MQNFGSSRDVLIRMHLEKNQSSADLSQKVMEVLQAQDKAAELRRVEFVGPQVGRELAEYGALALLVTAAGIVLYLWLRFEWRFGLSAIIANLHDVVIILGFRLLPVGVLAPGAGRGARGARLLGERVGHRVRPVREVLPQDAQGLHRRVIDAAITSTISRTIITHGSTQVMATTMLLFGGPALHYFALALTIGILFGIYSSVLVASPLVMWLGARREQFIVAGKRKTTGRATSRKAPSSSYLRIWIRLE